MSSDGGRFDDIFNAVKDQEPEAEPKTELETLAQPKTAKSVKRSQEGVSKSASGKEAKAQTKAREFWNDLEPQEKEATVRLNVDIPISLNDKLAEKARKLRQPKTELVRKLIEWAINDSSE